MRMPRTAKEVDEIFREALNAGDVDQILALYDPKAVFVTAPGQEVLRSHDEIRAFTANVLKSNPELTVELVQFVETDGIALFSVRYAIEGDDGKGRRILMQGIDSNVVRRQPDGTWRTLIDNPFHLQFITIPSATIGA